MSDCTTSNLINEYVALRKKMQTRIAKIASFYDHSKPLSLFFATMCDDPELEAMDRQLQEMEEILPDWYEFDQ